MPETAPPLYRHERSSSKDGPAGTVSDSRFSEFWPHLSILASRESPPDRVRPLSPGSPSQGTSQGTTVPPRRWPAAAPLPPWI